MNQSVVNRNRYCIATSTITQDSLQHHAGGDLPNKEKKEIRARNIFHYWHNFFLEQNIRTITKLSSS